MDPKAKDEVQNMRKNSIVAMRSASIVGFPASEADRWDPSQRSFMPARQDIAEMSELADLDKVSVLSYNVLSQFGARKLVRPEYGYVDPALLSITQRRTLLLREILSYDADIMCLQECDDFDDYWGIELTAAGYDSVYARRPSAMHDDGLVIAFKKELFQVTSSHISHLNEAADQVNCLNLKAKVQQDNHALFIILQPWEQCHLPSALCVATTQLASAPGLDLVRVLQTEFLCRELAKFNAPFQLPILLTGTFNALPSSDVYHVIHTGRRRPVPEAPATPGRPIADEPTATSLTLRWETPATPEDTPVLEYKIAMKNCRTPTVGFQHEIAKIKGNLNEYCVALLSSGITYQFRIAARNQHGWSHYSQPSAPMTTIAAEKLAADAKPSPIFVLSDVPPVIKPYSPSYASGRTPRFENQSRNSDVCARALVADESKYTTVHARADHDPALVHYEQFQSAYATAHEFLCEPELTFASEPFSGTIDYIFYSSGQLAPFQLLVLPTFDELAQIGYDQRRAAMELDREWVHHKPHDWKEALTTANDQSRYMGTWNAPMLPAAWSDRCASWLPNAMLPSDHLALVCVFAIRKDTLAVAWN